MAIDVNQVLVYRILPIENLEKDLPNGLFSKKNAPNDPTRIILGNPEIIGERDLRVVKCYPHTVVNDYVPFYFSVRTPMLYNIITGKGVPLRMQKDIVYICCQLADLATEEFEWCFTDGNAAKKITDFYKKLARLDKIDWRSIKTTDFRIDNADGDEDRIRKKHAEFLVKDHVPANKIKNIAVLNNNVKSIVEDTIQNCNLDIEVTVRPNYYF